MRIVIQRVKKATVNVFKKNKSSSINVGLLVFLGIVNEDSDNDIKWLTKKILQLRIFEDKNEKMNHSVIDIKGEVLLISQFTLHSSTKKGNRPSFTTAAPSEIAFPIYNKMISNLQLHLGTKLKTGFFGENMEVNLHNDGPVTIIIDSAKRE